MKTLYVCEICRNKYENPKDALACEAKGIPDISIYKIGCIDCDYTGFYKDCVFAIAEVRQEGFHSHYMLGRIACLATRDNGVGDNAVLGGTYCTGDYFWRKGVPAKPNVKMPAFQRMIKALQDQNIEPSIWNGEKAVPYEVWLK